MPTTAQTRITGGEWRGRVLSTPREQLLRPTRSVVREAIFNILRDEVLGADVVDLFAGAGTVGFEALARGASRVTFVDLDQRTVAKVRASGTELRWRERSRLVAAEALRWVRARPKALRDAVIVFVDAPYLDDSVVDVLEALGRAPPPVVVCEHHRARLLPDRIGGLALVRRGRYGITDLSVLRPAAMEVGTGE
jgi:16S rRNA (guanine966-N2)-methyltransferase